MAELLRTALFPIYQEYGAKTVPFGGWEMPVQFSGIKAEHEAVRNRAGLFDVSHMGEVLVSGSDALAFLQKLLTNDISKLEIGQALYAIMCYEDGGTVDDLLVYRKGEQHYLLVINAGNIAKDIEWLEQHQEGDVHIENISEQLALLALQGPLAISILEKLTAEKLKDIAYFHFREDVDIAGVRALVSRTGYTGEDGFEIYVAAEHAISLWKSIMEAGATEGLLPCGLGARDTLRFEARLPLYGQELSEQISPLEAGLGFAVKLKKEADFIGKKALQQQKEQGLSRKLVGLEMTERGIPRTGYDVYLGEQKIGQVTTGTQSPTLGLNIGLALLDSSFAGLEQQVEVQIRKKRVQAKVVATPFYKREREE